MTRFTAMRMPLGSVGIVATSRGLVHLLLTQRTPTQARKLLQARYGSAEHDPDLLPDLQRQLDDYFAGHRVRFHVKIDLSQRTAFQREVLDACRRVGYGRTTTYGALARQIGQPLASRAVGQALGRNPVPLVIPCHRVVGCNGSLGGFSAEQGVKLKQWLLDLETS
jgi:methylated-DNA-[protein]-cysteine S-methyltransferase